MVGQHAITAWIFTRALGMVFVVAFLSLAVQARGLWGGGGVLPVRDLLEGTRWVWVGNDGVLAGAAVVGAVAASLLVAGVLQGWMMLVCFLLYLGFVSLGQEFMSFQWDALLLEVGFVCRSLELADWIF